MNVGYVADTRSQYRESIGMLIHDWRSGQAMRLEEIAKKVSLSMDGGERLSLTTLIHYLMGIEQGNFYGPPSLLARKGKKGEQNLKRTALYLSLLGIPREHQIIEGISIIDPRFLSLYDSVHHND